MVNSVTGFVLQPTQEGELRRRVLFWLPSPLLAIGLVALVVGGGFSAAGWTILLASSVGVGTLLLTLVVQPTPLPEGLAPPVSARRSLHRFRQFTHLRLALALATVVIGAAASLVGGGLYPVMAAALLAWPQMLLAMPTFFTITRARRAMEAWGTTAYLWHALSRPAKVTWPIVTPAVRAWRAQQVERSRESMRRKLEEKAWRKAVDEEKENSSREDGRDAQESSSMERTTPIRPLGGASADEATEVLPHLSAGAGEDVKDAGEDGDGSERPSAELRPTAVLPHLGAGDASGDSPRATVNRAARRLFERGSGALDIAVRRTRRGTQSVRRPESSKP